MKYDYFMTERVVKVFRGLCFPQIDPKFTTKQQRLVPLYDFGSRLRFNIGNTLRGDKG